MQDYVDNAISSTVNLPNSATVEDIKNIYMEAWKAGLKGITVFRDGCERGNILGVDTNKKKDEVVYDSIDPETRRGVKKIDGTTVRECTSCVKSLYVTVNKLDNGKAFEVFTNASGGCKTNINTLSRLISLALRSGVKASRIIDELRANQCPACQLLRRQGNEEIALSCSNAIADAIELALEVEDKKEEDDDVVIKRPCPSCGKHTLIPEGKCVTCSNCGWSKCE
jgi:ribonucleoside-diphosphate reductase alpha chain